MGERDAAARFAEEVVGDTQRPRRDKKLFYWGQPTAADLDRAVDDNIGARAADRRHVSGDIARSASNIMPSGLPYKPGNRLAGRQPASTDAAMCWD